MTYNQTILIIFISYLVLSSLVALFLYKKDKAMASKGTEVRIKEKTLLEIAILGGALGAFIGRIVFHHKTDKIYFSIVIYLSLVAQLGLLVLAILLGCKAF